MTATLSIGVLGSAFDPPTRGHKDVIKQASAQFDLILLIPCAAHAFFKRPLPFDQRLEMLTVFAQELTRQGLNVQVSRLEQDIAEQQPNLPVRTWDVMTWLENSYKSFEDKVSLSFIRGPDNAMPETWQRFYRWQDIENNWSLFTAREQVKARSSQVRNLLQNPTSDIDLQLQQLVTPAVQNYIIENRLYTAG